jgi:hypothetical protein
MAKLNQNPQAGGSESLFVNEERLSGRQWLVVAAILALAAWLAPVVWQRVERFETGPDYRIPYTLSKDYWLYKRRAAEVAGGGRVAVLGDSVVWGEYVLPDGTLPHFLSREAGSPGKFANCGVNGLFPLALEGLSRYYGGAFRNRKILLQCNVLWMSSPKADLSVDKEENFNHSRLVPQWAPRIPCYKADASERLGAAIERNFGFFQWINHLQNAYFDQKSILNWTLADDGKDPAHYPNSYKNPLAQVRLEVPAAPASDPDRGPSSPRHKSWTEGGNSPAQFEWVGLESSLQWAAFQRLAGLLRERGNDVFVLLGPFNESFVAPESQAGYRKIHDGVAGWLEEQRVPHLAPPALPSPLYADASHPLTQGYEALAKTVWGDAGFQKWLKGGLTADVPDGRR